MLNINAGRCCVCKEGDVNLHLHHIDLDRSNTTEENLAVLCVRHHDHHHRPEKYQGVNHLELGATKIKEKKQEWEEFVREARQEHPQVLAMVTGYGTERHIHSAELVMQRNDGKLVYRKVYTLRTSNFDSWTTSITKELAEISPTLKVAFFNEPDTDEQCPTCGVGLSRVVNEELALKITDPTWRQEAEFKIFIYEHRPSIDACLMLRERMLLDIRLHLCNQTHIHALINDWQQRYPLYNRPSIRTQITKIMSDLVAEWEPACVLLGTGDPKRPRSIQQFKLPRLWEEQARPARR